MAVKTAKSRKKTAVPGNPAHKQKEADLVQAFEAAFAKANGASNGIKVGPTARTRLIEYFRVAVAPQLDEGIAEWQGPVRTFVLHCMSELARSVAKDPDLVKRGITRALLDRHTREHRPRWEKRCPMPPVLPEGYTEEKNPRLGWACLRLQEEVG